MTRQTAIEILRRQIYGMQPSDDADITEGLVNQWLEPALAVAAKSNYGDNFKLDGVAYVNGGFYTTFKGLEVETDEQFLWRIELPQMPVGIGSSEGINTIQLKDSESRQLSRPFIFINQAQKSYYMNMRPIPSKTLCYQEGSNIYIISNLILNGYTAQVSMISGGDMSNMQSELNIPNDYFPIMAQYIYQQLTLQRNSPKDLENDGVDQKSTA
jgi:hypothetical protein